MTRRITHFIKEHENKLNLFETIYLDVEVARKLEDFQNITIPIPDTDEVLPLIFRKEYQ
jgi:hypothetical protein